jgi:WD40 repeat protein
VASGGDDGTVRVWDFTLGKNKQIYLFDQKIGGKVLSLAWVPGSTRFIVAGSEDGQIRRYDLDKGELNCHTLSYYGPIEVLAANPGTIGEIAAGTRGGMTLVFPPSR